MLENYSAKLVQNMIIIMLIGLSIANAFSTTPLLSGGAKFSSSGKALMLYRAIKLHIVKRSRLLGFVGRDDRLERSS